MIIDKELTLLAVDPRRQNLSDARFSHFVVRGGGPVDKVETVTGVRDLIAQLGLCRFGKLLFKGVYFPFSQRARLCRELQGNGTYRQNPRDGSEKRQLFRTGKLRNEEWQSHRRIDTAHSVRDQRLCVRRSLKLHRRFFAHLYIEIGASRGRESTGCCKQTLSSTQLSIFSNDAPSLG